MQINSIIKILNFDKIAHYELNFKQNNRSNGGIKLTRNVLPFCTFWQNPAHAGFVRNHFKDVSAALKFKLDRGRTGVDVRHS